MLPWFVLGNAIIALSSFQYNLQNAHGELGLHVKGSTLSAVIQIPVIYYAATRFGALGAGIAWFGFRLVWFLWWTPIVHGRFVPNVHWKWLFVDIVPVTVVSIVGIYLIATNYTIDHSTRISIFIDIIVISIYMLIISSLGSIKVIRLLKKNIVCLVRSP